MQVPLAKVGPHDLTGNGYAAAGSRLSFLFDLRGPCVVVDTACSGALVALNSALGFVRQGDSTFALAAGVSLMLQPSFVHVGAAVAGMLSSTGHCHAFDAAADGYCRGEGIGLVALEVLTPQMRDASTSSSSYSSASVVTLTACAVRHNGQSATFTALNSASQKRLLDACVFADPARLGCVEAHGTGTRLGDPIELAGLAAFCPRKKSNADSAVRVAGVKGLVGHAEPAAGGAGLLALLAAAMACETAVEEKKPKAQSIGGRFLSIRK